MWVMSEVEHADSKMTTDVYAQLLQRAQRDHGQAFDALVRRARELLGVLVWVLSTEGEPFGPYLSQSLKVKQPR
jgi:hypothetical protein